MKVIILKVVEGKGKSGKAKTGQKRFLFTEDTIDKFNVFVNDYYNLYKDKFPKGTQRYEDIRKQFLDLVLKYQDSELMEYEVEIMDTVILVGNVTKLSQMKLLDCDETLFNVSQKIKRKDFDYLTVD